MNYIYDILLNFQKEFYDFYEWNQNDKLIHIKKIPIFKINDNDYINIKNSLIKIDKNFLLKIFNKTEMLTKTKTRKLNYLFLISTGYESMGIKLNKNGININKSSLLLNENEEISNIAYNLETTTIKYEIIQKKNKNYLLTRKEQEVQNYILKKLNKLNKLKKIEILKFLYLECFNKKENNPNTIINNLEYEIKNNTKNYEIIYNFFKTIEQK